MQRRTLIVLLILFLALPLFTSETEAYSDPTGIYARVDKVVFEPNATSPQRIQVWGAFSLANQDDRNSYEPPQRGYLYFTLKPGKEEICRKEWADFKAIAGSDQVVGFGVRFMTRPRLRKADEKAADPDEYPINYGVVKISERRSDYAPVRDLKALPREHD
jgi:hypothetical protein